MRTRDRLPAKAMPVIGVKGRIGLCAGLMLAALAACTASGPTGPEAPAAAASDAPGPATSGAASATPEPAPVVDRGGRMVVEAMEYPWSAIGRVNTGGRGFCTGVLIAPRLVMTSASCLYDAPMNRWWPPEEVHFVAGYQRETAIVHSAARSYEVAADFAPATTRTLASVTNNWALLTLETRIGYAAGWLALQWQDAETQARLARGEGLQIAAGYRQGSAHALTVETACAARACAGSPVEAALSALVFIDGELRLLGHPASRARALAGAIGSDDFAALSRGDQVWGDSRPPLTGLVVARQPRDSIARLLRHLGHLVEDNPSAGQALLADAIRDFEGAAGLQRTGTVSVALLGELLRAATRGPISSVGRLVKLQ